MCNCFANLITAFLSIISTQNYTLPCNRSSHFNCQSSLCSLELLLVVGIIIVDNVRIFGYSRLVGIAGWIWGLFLLLYSSQQEDLCAWVALLNRFWCLAKLMKDTRAHHLYVWQLLTVNDSLYQLDDDANFLFAQTDLNFTVLDGVPSPSHYTRDPVTWSIFEQ